VLPAAAAEAATEAGVSPIAVPALDALVARLAARADQARLKGG
jgi:DNA repair protein RadA/Sms